MNTTTTTTNTTTTMINLMVDAATAIKQMPYNQIETSISKLYKQIIPDLCSLLASQSPMIVR